MLYVYGLYLVWIDHFWTVEMALPLKDLAKDATNINVPPKEGDQWRINFSR